MKELFRWPDRHLRFATEGPASGGSTGHIVRRATMLGHCDVGVEVHTHHSGTGNGEGAAKYLFDTCAACGWGRQDSLVVKTASDTFHASRLALLADELAEHVFGDIASRLSDDIGSKVHDKKPGDGASYDECMQCYKEIHDLLMGDLDAAFGSVAPCHRHGHDCCFKATAVAATPKLRVLIAGTSCVGWSDAGKKAKLQRPSMLTFLLLVADAVHQKYDVICHENTEGMPDELLEYFFGPTHLVVPLRLAPYHLGMPVRRPRKYTICIRKGIEVTSANFSQAEFLALFAQVPCLDPHDLWCAPPEATEERYMRRATECGMLPKGEAGKKDPYLLLTPYQKRRIQTAIQSMPEGVDPSQIFVDIQRTPKFTTPGLFIPTLLTNSSIWSVRLCRLADPKEMLIFQGIPSYDAVSEDYAAPWARSVEAGISATDEHTLAGNAMCCPISGTVLLYALASTRPRTTRPSTMRFRSMASVLDFDIADEDD